MSRQPWVLLAAIGIVAAATAVSERLFAQPASRSGEVNTSVVSQVVDFEKQVVHTTWTSPEKNLAAFQGTLRPDGP